MNKVRNGIDSLRLVQFTDMHLYADVNRDLLGVVTEQSFLDTLQLARAEQWPVTAVLATGDLVHDYSVAGYRRLRAHFATLDVPVHCLPGNHDDPDLMAQHLAGGLVQISTCVDYNTWRIVLLDSTIRGSDAGHLARGPLDLLEAQLASAAGRHVLICLHHNPVAVGSPWLDTMMVGNAAEFFAIVDRYPAVRAILWGHAASERRYGATGRAATGEPFHLYTISAAEQCICPGRSGTGLSLAGAAWQRRRSHRRRASREFQRGAGPTVGGLLSAASAHCRSTVAL